MMKRWLIYAAVAMTVAIVSGGIVRNVSRHFRRHVRIDRAPMQIAKRVIATPAPEANGQEESEAIELIDLSALQKGTPEPSGAGFLAPADLPPVADGRATPLVQTSEPVVADFKPYSADGPEPTAMPKASFVSFWTRVGERLWGGKIMSDAFEECEQLSIMPRSVGAAPGPQESCPCLGGCPYDGSQYRKANKPAATGEEEQSIPRTLPNNLIPKPGDLHKQPKLDTMEIRPGDIPWSWVPRPF